MPIITIPLSSDQLDDFIDKFYDIPEPDVILKQSIDVEYAKGMMSYYKVKTEKGTAEVIVNLQPTIEVSYLRCDSALMFDTEPPYSPEESEHRLRFNIWRDVVLNATFN